MADDGAKRQFAPMAGTPTSLVRDEIGIKGVPINRPETILEATYPRSNCDEEVSIGIR